MCNQMARLLHVPPSTCEFVAKLAFNDPDTVFDVDMQMSWDHTLVADIPFEVSYTLRTNGPLFYAFAGEACFVSCALVLRYASLL